MHKIFLIILFFPIVILSQNELSSDTLFFGNGSKVLAIWSLDTMWQSRSVPATVVALPMYRLTLKLIEEGDIRKVNYEVKLYPPCINKIRPMEITRPEYRFVETREFVALLECKGQVKFVRIKKKKYSPLPRRQEREPIF